MKTCLLRCPLLLLAVFMTSLAFSQNCTLNSLTDITVAAEKGKSGAVVTFPESVQACGKITYSPLSGTTFPIGVTNVTATSANGKTTKVFTVTVLDAEPPVITTPEPLFINTDAGTCSATIANLSAPDVNDKSATIVGTRSDNQPLNSAYPKGVTTITWSATDAGGNKATTTQLVVVSDKQAPVMVLPFTDASIIKNTDANICAYTVKGTELDVSATDNCAGAVAISYSWWGACSGNADNSLTGKVFEKGTTTVWCTASDGNGNVAEWTFDITVVDKQAPVMVLPFSAAAINQNTDANVCSYTVKSTEFDASATDNCSQATISYYWSGACSGNADNSLAGTVFAKGKTRVWCTATDASGNKSEWIFDITVEDHQAPVINSVRATPDMLWAPNHKMTDITLTYDVNENCGGLTYRVVSITSNEPVNGIGDGNTDADWYEGTDGQHIQVRAERSGTGTDRIYTIIVKVIDGSGNESDPVTVTVTVPHDQGKTAGSETQKTLNMVVAPNPSQNDFTIKATSENTTDKITMIVSDSMGRPVYRKNNITSGQVVTIGSDLQPGSYFVVLQQGNQTAQQQIIKVK